MGRPSLEKYIITPRVLELGVTDLLRRVQHPFGAVGHPEGEAGRVLLPKI